MMILLSLRVPLRPWDFFIQSGGGVAVFFLFVLQTSVREREVLQAPQIEETSEKNIAHPLDYIVARVDSTRRM